MTTLKARAKKISGIVSRLGLACRYRLFICIAFAPSLISCGGDSVEIVCRSLPRDVIAASPVPVRNVDNLALSHLRTQPPVGASRQIECRVGYEFAVTGIADLLRDEDPDEIVQKYFSVTTDTTGGRVRVDGGVLIVTVLIQQSIRSGTYETVFNHPDGRVLRTAFHHFGFTD